jgi:hypothetical protein
MATRWTGEMFDSYHYAIKSRSSKRKMMARKKGKLTLSFFSFVFSLSIYFSMTGEATMREKEK